MSLKSSWFSINYSVNIALCAPQGKCSGSDIVVTSNACYAELLTDVLGLRQPGLEFHILCLESIEIWFISPSSGRSQFSLYVHENALQIYSSFIHFTLRKHIYMHMSMSMGMILDCNTWWWWWRCKTNTLNSIFFDPLVTYSVVQ